MNSSAKALMAGIGVIIIAVVIIVIASGSKSSTSTTNSSMSAMHSDHQTSNAAPVEASAVTIDDYKFGPQAIKVKVGTKVTWTNQDAVKHTVTIDKGGAIDLKSQLFSRDETYSYTFTKAGMYHYHCEPHPYMKGSVTVTD